MGGMLGYGPFHYRYASGREGDACKLSIASNASYVSLYCSPPTRRATSPNGTSTGARRPTSARACVRIKKLADLEEKALVALIKETAKMDS